MATAKALPAANRVTAGANLVIRGKASKAHVRREIRSNSFWLGRGGARRSKGHLQVGRLGGVRIDISLGSRGRIACDKTARRSRSGRQAGARRDAGWRIQELQWNGAQAYPGAALTRRTMARVKAGAHYRRGKSNGLAAGPNSSKVVFHLTREWQAFESERSGRQRAMEKQADRT